ncbi:MAG: S1 RNA-binding domain-containing protein [Anaerolineae bacterium]|nr:S1 RNA-binding domain-containing protein [Anaerolineae bacterium]
MSNDFQRRGFSSEPPSADEGYWAALLEQGEFADLEAVEEPRDGSHAWDNYDIGNGARRATEYEDGFASDWQMVRQTYEQDETVELMVIGYNRGGLLVGWNNLRGFVPASQLVYFPEGDEGLGRREELADRVGETLRLRVIELDPLQNRLILSERAAQVRPGTRASLLTQLKSGDIIRGRVTNLCDFGAFVDLGGLEGLIHISELSWGRVGHPKDLLARGQDVKVYVMGVDRANGRIALSLKRLQPDPWETVEERYQVGQMVEGLVTNVVDFGAFACIEEGLEGLIHVSELAEGHFLHPRNVVQEGQIVQARILNIDGAARRLGLSLRRDNGAGEFEAAQADGGASRERLSALD